VAPVLSATFSPDSTRVFSAGCDSIVKCWDLASNQSVTVGQHAAPIKHVSYSADLNCLISGSWDKTVKYWDMRTSNPPISLDVKERVYAMDMKGALLVVAIADRNVQVIDLRKPTVILRTQETPLKYQSRCVACFPDQTGYAIGSIEGRVAIQYVGLGDTSKNFAFKCHRESNDVFAVNGITFHPIQGTFATIGSDGTYCFWDKDVKQRLKIFQKTNNSLTTCAFNHDGTIFAYGIGYDWSKGVEYAEKYRQPNTIMLHATRDDEIRKRPR